MASSEVRTGERPADSGFWSFPCGASQRRTQELTVAGLVQKWDGAGRRLPENSSTRRGVMRWGMLGEENRTASCGGTLASVSEDEIGGSLGG